MTAEVTLDRVRLALRDALRQLRAAPVLAASAAVALAVGLTVAALHVFALGNTDAVLDDIARDLSATVYLDPGATREGVERLLQDAAADPLVAHVTFRTAAEEKTRIVALLSAELLSGVDDEAIPTQPVIAVAFVPEALDAPRFERMQALVARLASSPGVTEVGFEADHVGVLFAIGDLVRLTGSLVGLAALLVGVFFVALFIKVGLDRRASELALLRALGASEPYLYAPAYVAGALVGLAGGAIAIAIAALVDGRLGALARTAPAFGVDLDLLGLGLLLWGLFGGLALAVVGTWTSVRRHRP